MRSDEAHNMARQEAELGCGELGSTALKMAEEERTEQR